MTLGVAALQCIVGLWNNNLLLLCHCAHSTFDAFQLGIATMSTIVTESESAQVYRHTTRFSYGLRRLPIVGTFFNATLGILVSMYLLVESLHRFSNGESGTYQPGLLLVLTLISLLIKLYGVTTIQHAISDKNEMSKGRMLGSACRRVLRLLGRRSSSKRRRRIGVDESSLDLMLTMMVGDVVRGTGIVLACILSQGGMTWFTHVDMLLSWLTCAFILSSVWPIFVSSGNILLQRTPENVHVDMSKCLKQVAAEKGVLEICEEHFWLQTKDVLVGSLCVVVDGAVEEKIMLQRVHEIFRERMTISLLTVQINKEGSVMSSSR